MKIKMILGISLLALTASVNAASIDTVATIKNVQGSVLVEQNGQRVPAKKGMSLQEGDSIFVLEKAGVNLAYAGCSSALSQNTLLTVSASAPCASGDVIGVGADLTEEQTKAMLDKYNAVLEAGGTAQEAEAAAIKLATTAVEKGGLGLSTATATEAAGGLASLSTAAGAAGGLAGLSAGAVALITGGAIVVVAAAGGGGGDSTPASP